MNISALAGARRGRWAISFADLLLLLLGFFVMLQASGQRRDAMLAQVRQQFGGEASSPMEIHAAELFLPSHGVPFTGLHERIGELQMHHAYRLEKMFKALAPGPQTAAQVMNKLFAHRKEIGIDDMFFAMLRGGAEHVLDLDALSLFPN